MQYLLYIMRFIINFVKRIYNLFIKVFKVLKYKANRIRLSIYTTFNKFSILESNIKIGKFSDISNSVVGSGTYIRDFCIFPGTKIGRFCSIGSYSRVVIGNHPTSQFVSTHPAFYSPSRQAGFTFVKKKIFDDLKFSDNNKKFFVTIGNDVWIGENVLIMQGVIIGDGAIIGSGSIVTKNIDSYSICAGVPAKKIRMRFSDEQIKQLLKIKWWNWNFEEIAKNAGIFSDINIFLKKQKKYL